MAEFFLNGDLLVVVWNMFVELILYLYNVHSHFFFALTATPNVDNMLTDFLFAVIAAWLSNCISHNKVIKIVVHNILPYNHFYI